MNILHINKYHYHRDGASNIYLNTASILEEKGHRSVFFAMHNPDNIKQCATSEYFMPFLDLNYGDFSIVDKLKIFGRLLYSFEAKKRLSTLLDKYSVDIAHIHNIYHHISPSILREFKKRKIPVVMTLHDYKLVCGSYSMIVGGKPCDACRDKKYFMKIKKRCVKDSLIKSILTTCEMYLHHKILGIYDNVDVFISPSLFLLNKLREMGFDNKIAHLPNFIDIKAFDALTPAEKAKENSVVYFGRLSREKGLRTLVKAAELLLRKNKRIEIKLIGEGPLRDELEGEVKSKCIKNVRFLGFKANENLFREVIKSMVAVIPSEWYENNPVSILVSFAMGIPVIGARIGGIPELIKDNETGLTFEPGNASDLQEKICNLVERPDRLIKMGEKARRLVKEKFNAERYYSGLMRIYQIAIEKKGAAKKQYE